MKRKNIARVILNLSLDRAFDYLIPRDMQVRIGSLVEVPFNRSTRQGIVIGLTDRSHFEDQLKEIAQLHGDHQMIPPAMLKLGHWMADYYCCTQEQAVMALLPAVVRSRKVSRKTVQVVAAAKGVDLMAVAETLRKKAPRQAELLGILALHKECTTKLLKDRYDISSSVIKALEEHNHITISDVEQDRDPFDRHQILPSTHLELTDEQQVALDQILKSMDSPKRETILLYGVTGSGKTEVYLQAIDACLKRGEEAIVLVPEIALTPQTMERFRSRFGDEVSVLHSHLSDGERLDEWTKISQGRVRIAVGARSALFAPFHKLGLIVVDEEHETSYKQEIAPRYNARDMSVMRGHLENVTVVLGTATPSLESYYNTEKGKYQLARLTKRVDDQEMPHMVVVDLAEEAAAMGTPQILSRRLISEMRSALENGEQAMLFLNRRGYATQLQCLKCGHVAECDDCSVKYTYHRKSALIICHMCGQLREAPSRCPECRDPGIRYSGMGTEKIEACVKGVLPYARVMRMDSDTMTRKESYREALTSFRAGDVDILIGTQMIAKGLHFPNVTLVGVVFADLSLHIPDFRAAERTFQLIVQVAGRAGRGDLPGRVIVQTYTPYHPAIQAAAQQDYELFYKQEMPQRKELRFPPESHFMLIQFRGPNESTVEQTAQEFRTKLEGRLGPDSQMTPVIPCAIVKKRAQYYYQILINENRIVTLSRVVKQTMQAFGRRKDIWINVDVDPYSVL